MGRDLPVNGSAAAAYEELRSHMLAGSPGGQHFGLILILREGLASWIERRVTASSPAVKPIRPDRSASSPLLSEPFQSEIVSMLASIALNGREEIKP